jgi:hypothetical protein
MQLNHHILRNESPTGTSNDNIGGDKDAQVIAARTKAKTRSH